jgi:hypothetical protein
MSQSARSLSVAVDRASLATDPQSRHLIFKPCRHLLGRRSFGSRLKQLNREAISALALALEICSVIGCRCFEPRDLRHQCLKPWLLQKGSTKAAPVPSSGHTAPNRYVDCVR